MRGLMVIAVLGLAGCGGEHMGMNPNYMWDGGRYADYRLEREVALLNNSAEPPTIPIALPTDAPTGEEIAGASPVRAPATKGLSVGPDGRATRIRRTSAGTPAPTSTPALDGTDGYGQGTGMTATTTAAATTAPAPVTRRTPRSLPILARYAADMRHDPGVRGVFPRNGGSAATAQAACAVYGTPDDAQRDFLRNGGPQRDPKGMDPDGDGYVCTWDPRPVRDSHM